MGDMQALQTNVKHKLKGTRNKAHTTGVQGVRDMDAKPRRKAKEDLAGNASLLPRDVREGLVLINRARHIEARENW